MSTNSKEYDTEFREDWEKKYISIAFEKKQLKLMELEAQQKGYSSRAEYIRDMVEIGRKQQPHISPIMESHLKEIKLDIRRIGNNLNQMARHTNQTKKAPTMEVLLNELLKLETAICTAIKDKFLNR